MKKYVQYGCGFSSPDGWTNYDSSPTLRFERIPILGKMISRNEKRFPFGVKYGDIVKGLPEKENSCQGIFCSHILEHLAYKDFKIAIANTYKLLQPGGIFRGIVPDLGAAIQHYVDNFENADAPASDFMNFTMLGIEERKKDIFSAFVAAYGNSKHLWMWDFKSIKFELAKAGFRNIRSCEFGDSIDSQFSLVEEKNRFWNAVAFECEK